MANTVIQLKKSATPSATPSSLANGELAINFADGKLFYKAANGTIVEYRSADGLNFGTVNANGTLIVSDTNNDVFTLAPGDNINIIGDAINDVITISANLLSALVIANAAFNKANTANQTADLAYTHANNAYAKANTANTTADLAFGKANTANQTADLAFGQANVARTHANTAHLTANAAFDQANTARSHANTAHLTANASFNQANTARTHANNAYNIANLAFDKANTGGGGGAYFSGNNGDVGSVTGLGDIFRVHTNVLNANVTIYSGNNALAAGPITIATGKTLTIQTNARVAIV